MTLVPPDQYPLYIAAAYGVAAIGLGGLLIWAWASARAATRLADAARAARTTPGETRDDA